MTPNELLKQKLALYGIHVNTDEFVLTNERYQTIIEDYELPKDFGVLSTIFEWVKVDVQAGLNGNESELVIMLRYYWRHTEGGSNGHWVTLVYEINPAVDGDLPDGC